jgi:antitoxin (DNA-binding transcriptional repressor) of toxin-antitoxin stability system
MTQVTLDEAGAQWARLVEQVRETGEDVVFMTADNKPVARLTPLPAPRAPRQPGSAKGLIHVPDGFDEPLEDFAEYMH